MLEFSNSLSAMAVLACTLVSGLHGFVQDNRRCNVVNPLLMGLRLAKDASEQYSKNITLCPSSDGKSCRTDGDWSYGWAAFVDRDGDGEMQPAEVKGVIAKSLNQTAKVRIRSEQTHFSFAALSRGYITHNTAGTLAVCDPRGPEHSRMITVNERGRAVQSPFNPQVHAGRCT